MRRPGQEVEPARWADVLPRVFRNRLRVASHPFSRGGIHPRQYGYRTPPNNVECADLARSLTRAGFLRETPR
jgi:hypothetical protein